MASELTPEGQEDLLARLYSIIYTPFSQQVETEHKEFKELKRIQEALAAATDTPVALEELKTLLPQDTNLLVYPSAPGATSVTAYLVPGHVPGHQKWRFLKHPLPPTNEMSLLFPPFTRFIPIRDRADQDTTNEIDHDEFFSFYH